MRYLEAISEAAQGIERLDPIMDGSIQVKAALITLVRAVEATGVEAQVLGEGLQNLRELFAMRGAPPALSRVDALKAAREHVEAMSTNGRGYQDGVKLADKVAAMETFARFLMGETP
ncbi:hypothetical protein ABZY06_33860 [Streptomyces sp. NPDC006540]|uniref:hypothetical protein n=1 Tax=Streptomyces sp. NPDC006540 TaxID=3155353 RepID=UPI0033AF0D7F